MVNKAHKYTQEFKNSTIQLALNSEKSAYQIAQDLGMSDKTLYAWLRDYRKKHHLISELPNRTNNSPKESLEEENRRLRKENSKLKMERDILKKAAAFFAKEAH